MYVTTENRNEPILITEVLLLSHEDYAAYYERMHRLPDSARQEYEPEVEHLYLLVLGEDHADGIIVDFSGRVYEGVPAFVPNARMQLNTHIKRLADYCVREGTEYTENGKWPVTYEELYYHFDQTTVSSRNGIGALLREELQRREEINELIMTEDCIEMTYHLEYCLNCQQDGAAGALNLLSLMGCNLYDVHLQASVQEDEDAKPVSYCSGEIEKLYTGILTEQGKADWSDVLRAGVKSISGKGGRIIISLEDCNPSRLHDFCATLKGETSQEYYERCVADPSKNHAPSGEQPNSLRDGKVSDLIAAYEEIYHVPHAERVTYYFGDYGSHFFQYGKTLKDIQPVYEKALAVIEMSDEEFRSNEDMKYRSDMIGRMRECLLAKNLQPGETVLFVGTEPYGGPGDFALRGGTVKEIDPRSKTCTIEGAFFDMTDVPLRYVLGRHNAGISEKHYGKEHVEVLYGEYPALAQRYLREAEEQWEQQTAEPDESPVQSM